MKEFFRNGFRTQDNRAFFFRNLKSVKDTVLVSVSLFIIRITNILSIIINAFNRHSTNACFSDTGSYEVC